ncbi:hypothetical protein AWM75_07080 [Aerococcus urinaehominis]|uniref:Uncharacterized protein n=1 Tax=Aerococcus urinaehominis TaxID=128944 RepID=A0A0X8FLZ8_9LACT|nr:biotin/lipoyl-containing protein [Aerococcus urinaehominis]AMB99740.1 hypothetical protein AWM75_07080 [Aerococcus urinaehominis]SDM10796.1 Biotin carboxyl carrier protein [Aerococcus urinaehominis]
MLRKFRIRLNDKEYMVEMEELTPGTSFAPPAQPAPASQPAAEQAPATAAMATSSPEPAGPAPSSQPGAGQEVTSPMPGTILDIMVAEGDQVNEDQPVLILEAMKMENQIVAPLAGRVTSILVTKGQAVDVSELLFTIEG